jgi:hypothetical protein
VRKLPLNPTGEPASIAFSADGRFLAVGGSHLSLWEVASGQHLASLGDRPGNAKLVFFNAGATLLTAIGSGVVWRWQLG